MARTKKTQKEPEIIQNGDSLEMELQNLIIEAQKPVAVGSEEMKNKLFAFLGDWDSLNVIGSKQAQMLHYSVRQRLSNAIGAAFGHLAVAQYEREKANKLKS